MNYQIIYDNLINQAKNRLVDGYTEKHHILPKSMGGSNQAFNIVKLTGNKGVVEVLCLAFGDDATLCVGSF